MAVIIIFLIQFMKAFFPAYRRRTCLHNKCYAYQHHNYEIIYTFIRTNWSWLSSQAIIYIYM